MKNSRIALIFILTFLAVGLLAQAPVLIGFKDPVTPAAANPTLTLVRLEDPTYPIGTPVASRWFVQSYISTDNVIDPLGEDGLPTNNDILGPTLQLIFGPTGALGLSNLSIPFVNVGSYLYLRIFNATTHAAATKYMAFHTPYQIPGNNASPNILPAYGWFTNPAWRMIVPPPADHTISGTFSTTSWDLLGIQMTATGIAPEDIIFVGGDYEITVPDGWSGTVTPTKAGHIIDPPFRTYTDVTADLDAQNYVVKKNVSPAAPAIVFPTVGQVFDWAEATEVTLEWAAGAGYNPEGYMLSWNGGAFVDMAMETEWTTPELTDGAYTWAVKGYINTPMGKSFAPVRSTINSRTTNPNAIKGEGEVANGSFSVVITPVYTITLTSDPAGAEIYHNVTGLLGVAPVVVDPAVIGIYTAFLDGYTFEAFEVTEVTGNIVHQFVGTPVPADDYPEGDVVVIEPGFTITITGGAGNISGAAPTDVLNPAFVVAWEQVIVLSGPGPWSITIVTTEPWVTYKRAGVWYSIANLTGTVVIDILPLKDEVIEIKTGSGGDPTLPVELSSFTAVLTAQNFVKLTWVSQSETNMLGYRVYRGESDVQASAILVTPIMIQATNSSTTQVYSIDDREVTIGATYWYWLESVDYGPSHFYGPQSVIVTGEVPPVLPETTTMRSAYPNPFRANNNTTIEVAVKAGETGTVTIYNVLGQAVKSFSVSEGNHNLKWNGRDSKGNICGSGIYFYKLATPTMNQTKKMVIVK
jgi:hypothetical protein